MMTLTLINPKNNQPLLLQDGNLVDSEGNIFPIIKSVARITDLENYTENFGLQWNKFDKTQIDREADGLNLSRSRFFAETKWDKQDLVGQCILEVGSGAGRFSKVVLEHTKATLYSIDYSDAVAANYKNNNKIAPDRFHLFQASIYEMPFQNDSFDKVFCLGVLQHTPDFEGSVKSLISKTKPGGEIVVDFYPINGWWTKIHAKYIFRHITKRMNHARLMNWIEMNIDWLIKTEQTLHRLGLGALTRFLPIVDIQGTFPKSLSKMEIREWAVLDTFDMFSPAYDNPQRIRDVAAMFNRHGADVTFAGFEHFEGFSAAVVRGIKRT